MSSVSSSSSSSSSSSLSGSFNRITGLSSGLDTETTIKGLTQGTQTKIDKQKQKLQLLQWKQQEYQDIATKLNDFQNKYFGTSSYSMLFSKELHSFAVTNSGSNYVKVTTSSDSVTGNIYIGDIVSLATAASVKSESKVSADPVLNVDLNYLSSLSGRSMKVTLDGQQKTITFSNKTYNSSDDVTAELQTQLNTAFGAGRITVSQNEDALTLHTDNSILTLNNSGLTGSEASYVIDFADGASNRINLANTLSEANLAVSPGDTVSFRINGKDFSFTSDNTFQEIMNTVNDADIGVVMSYSKTTDTFTLTASETGAASSVTFEDTEGSFLQSILGAGITTNGSNAVVKVGLNGETDVGSLTTLERSSNTFELDGTTYTLLNKAAGVTSEGITINISTDASTIADNINQFVTDYNTLLKTISDKLSEKKYSDYSPLTDSQKAELSDDEIKKWNEKAQSGLLNNDTYLTSIYNSLRSAWSSNVSSLNEDGTTIGTTLSDVGITTGIYSEKGQLKVDKDKLLAALNKDADSVIKFFSQKSSINYSQYASTNQKQQRYAESGLAWRIDDIVRNNLSTTGIKGALIELVGSPSNNFTGKTNYSKQIEDVNEKITELQEKLKDEQNHYWTKFSKMEANLTKLNSLSSWLSSQSSNS